MAASEATKEAVYLSRLGQERGIFDGSPLSFHCHNRSATDVAYNPERFMHEACFTNAGTITFANVFEDHLITVVCSFRTYGRQYRRLLYQGDRVQMVLPPT